MDFLDNIDLYPKIIIALTGLLAAFIKIKESYSSTKRKENIKLDLEIYELINKTGDFSKTDLKNSIESRIKKSLDSDGSGLTNFFVGLVVFVGFGLWSIDIFQNYNEFNGWIILTSFCSLTGLSMLFGKNENSKSKDVFFKIGIYDKSNFQFSFIITAFTGIITPVLYIKITSFSYWIFLTGLFFIIGLINLFKNVRRIR